MKRTIIINENQAYWLGLLQEDDGDSMFLDGEDQTEYLGANAPTSPNGTIVDTDDEDNGEEFQGKAPYASPMTTKKQGDMQTIQNGLTSRHW